MLNTNPKTLTFCVPVFLFQMLTEAIMHDCVTKLLKANDNESMECFCKLMTTIGKDLDHPKAKVRAKTLTQISTLLLFYCFCCWSRIYCEML